MSPKDFRNICHPEAKILNSLVNCAQTVRQTVRRSKLDVELTQLPVGQLKIVFQFNFIVESASEPDKNTLSFGLA